MDGVTAPEEGTTMKSTWKDLFADQSGAVGATVAVLMVAFLAMGSLVMDYGHMAWVQNELKTAADAGALAGARVLAPYTGTPKTPNWVAGQNMATQTVLLNAADAQPLTDCNVDYGYWSLVTGTLQSPGIIPTSKDLPAVRVTVAKAPGQNYGPLRMYLAPIFGVSARDLSAQAVGVISGPYSIPANSAFPMALPKSAADQWNQEPYPDVYIGSAYHDPEGGQWTSFLIDANNVPTIRDLIDNGNPTPLKVGDNIWIEPGTKTNLYEYAASKIGQAVVVPIVETDFSTHNYTPILGFASFFIEEASGGDDKYIKGHFVRVDPQADEQGAGGGPLFGYFIPAAKLVN